jgi:hypothetical protein
MQVKTRLKSLALSAVVASASFAVLPSAAFAQDVSESHFSAARDAVAASGATDRFDLILPNILQDVKTRFIANRPDLEAEITGVANDEAIALASRRTNLEKEVANIFAKVFTEEELRELEAFYSTDTGKKLLQETDVITRQVVAASRVWGRGMARDLETNVSKVLSERFGASAAAPAAAAGAAEGEAAPATQ